MWSTKLPKKEGWYWYKLNNNFGILKIFHNEYDDNQEKPLILFNGDEDCYTEKEFKNLMKNSLILYYSEKLQIPEMNDLQSV